MAGEVVGLIGRMLFWGEDIWLDEYDAGLVVYKLGLVGKDVELVG